MELLSIKDAASILCVKESTFRTWINRKQIPNSVIFRIGNTVRIIKPMFENWIMNGSL
jgi:excisionase family DNA binding protein